MVRWNYHEKGYISEFWLEQELLNNKFKKELKYIVVEGKLLENAEFEVEDILNCAFRNGFEYVDRNLINAETDFYEFIFKRK